MHWLRFLAVISATLLLASCTPDAPLKVGFIGGLSGRFADLGTAGRNGAVVAVDWRNARGGIRGKPVSLLIRDDEHLPATARDVFRALVDERVVAVVGPMTSAMASEILPLAEQAKTLLIGGTIVTDRLTGKDDYLVRVVADSREYAAQTARQLQHRLPQAPTLVLYDLANREYAEDWASNYAAEAARLGNPAVRLQPFDSARAGAAAAAAGAALAERSRLPQLIVLVCSAGDAAAIARLARQKVPGVQLAAAAWAATERLIEEGREAVDGMILQQYHDVDESGETFRAFAGEYQQRFGRRPDYAAVIAFDAMNVLLDTLETHPERAGLREAVLARRQFSGLTGLITLDPTGDARRPYFASQIRHGRYVALPVIDTP